MDIYLHVYHFMDKNGETVKIANNVNQLMSVLGFTNVRDCTMLLASPYFAADFFTGLATGVADPIYMIDPEKVAQHWPGAREIRTVHHPQNQAMHYFVTVQPDLADSTNPQVGSW